MYRSDSARAKLSTVTGTAFPGCCCATECRGAALIAAKAVAAAQIINLTFIVIS
jgi:hypothetical protein